MTATSTGSSHHSSGTPSQDAVASFETDSGLCVAVADGHGGSRYVRSAIGAQLAVRAAIGVGTQCLADPTLLRASVSAATGRLLETWRGDVHQHMAGQPLSPDELAVLNGDPLIAYGATVLLVVVRGAEAVAVQLGDGDIVAGWRDGTAWRPVPDDERNRAGQTTSLCLPDADRSFRFAGLDRDGVPPDVIIVSSDGYGNSFANPDWPVAVVADLVRLHDANGLEAIARAAPRWTADSASVGGDDTTVALVFRSGAARLPPMPPPPGRPVVDIAATEASSSVAGGERPATPVVRRATAIALTAVAAAVGIGVGWVAGSAGDEEAAVVTVETTARPETTAERPPPATTTTATTTTVARPTTTRSSTTTSTSSTTSTTSTSSTTSTTSTPSTTAGEAPSQQVVVVIGGRAFSVDVSTSPRTIAPQPEGSASPVLDVIVAGVGWQIVDGSVLANGQRVPVSQSWGTPASLGGVEPDLVLVGFENGDVGYVVGFDSLNRRASWSEPVNLDQAASAEPAAGTNPSGTNPSASGGNR